MRSPNLTPKGTEVGITHIVDQNHDDVGTGLPDQRKANGEDGRKNGKDTHNRFIIILRSEVK